MINLYELDCKNYTLYLCYKIMNLDNIYRGLIIVYPYGTYIKNRTKTIIIKSKNIPSISHKKLLLLENKSAYGLIELDYPKKIDIKKFRKLYPKHLITESDRKTWWPNYHLLYEYNIIKSHFFGKQLMINYPIGPQITVKPNNITIKKICIGTSGYNYRSMYPSGTKNLLEYYATYLNSVEINSTFYRMPTNSLIDHLYQMNLSYSIKVSRYITHIKRLKDVSNAWKNFFKSFGRLLSKINCFLFQFSATFIFNDITYNRLIFLGKQLDPAYHYAFEFRHGSWFNNDQITNLFAEYQWTLVIVHTMNTKSWAPSLMNGFNPSLSKYYLTSNNIYFRLHGSINKYHGSYTSNLLNKIYQFIQKKSVDTAFVYFNNTDDNSAFQDAIRFSNKFNKNNLK